LSYSGVPFAVVPSKELAMNAIFPTLLLPRWLVMWLIAFTIYGFCKALSWGERKGTSVALWKRIAYLAAWPGMDPDAFVATPRSKIDRPAWWEWVAAIAKTLLGVALLILALRHGSSPESEIADWVGMTGLILALHFGAFHLLSCVWRVLGLNAVPIMNRPVAARSLAEFWGRRWNLAFRDLTHRFVFRPLRRRTGPTSALILGFLVSGLVHDLVITAPAGGGYGWPTAYFVLQGVGVIFERSRFGRWLGLGSGWTGWIYCAALVVVPCRWLFPQEFVHNVIGPFLDAIGGGL